MHETKMAENEVTEVETKAERKRKPNFSINELSLITESVRKNIDIIQSKLTNNITNKGGKKKKYTRVTLLKTKLSCVLPGHLATIIKCAEQMHL